MNHHVQYNIVLQYTIRIFSYCYFIITYFEDSKVFDNLVVVYNIPNVLLCINMINVQCSNK